MNLKSPKLFQYKDDLTGGNRLTKYSRVKNKQLKESFRSQPCLICDSTETTVGHHVTTVGAGGGDTTDNLMPLCHIHHAEIHSSRTSRKEFFEKYLEARQWAEYHERFDLVEEP